MATCKDCFHYDACKGILDAVGIEMDAECQNQETLCGNFMSCNITKNIMTNADRIRAMTDEELAHFLVWHWNKKDYGLEWLKQPAE